MDRIIHKSVKLNRSPMLAFKLFTENERIESWLSPEAEVEPRVGGRYELFWDPKNREENSTLGCKITALEPGQFLSFEWRSPKQFGEFANNADPLTHVVVFFIPISEGTIIHLIHSGWRSSEEWEKASLWQERAWDIALEELVSQKNMHGT